MPYLKSFLKLIIIAGLLSFLFAACQEDSITNPDDGNNIDDKALIEKTINEDEVLISFEPNYNEDGAMDILVPKTGEIINPIRVGQKMTLVYRNIDVQIEGDTAYANIYKEFSGILYIAASLNDNSFIDTLIEKPFTSTITRNVILEKTLYNNTGDSLYFWKVIAVSLPEGGSIDINTGSITTNIEITQLDVLFPNGNTLTVTNPNDYYLERYNSADKRNIPVFGRGEYFTLTVSVKSLYEEDDFVTLTWGARAGGIDRTKARFSLVSSEFDGTYYNKVYSANFRTHFYPGFFHSIINVIPHQVVNDDSTPVENNSWGVPYRVN